MDWGLGHAARSVPVIENLLNANAGVIIAAANKPLDFLRLKFPKLQWVQLEGYQPRYQKNIPLALKIVAEIPKMLKSIKPAQKKLQTIIDNYGVDAIISDNRYELWNDNVYTVFMSHQLDILQETPLRIINPAIKKSLYSFIEKHNELWIPDFEENNGLSGKLSHVKSFPRIPHYFVGTLSRFENIEVSKRSENNIDLLCIMSGPEPQRTIFENLLIKQLENSKYKAVILSGNPATKEKRITKNITLLSHANDMEFAGLINDAKLIISRSGYSTLMDLATFGKKALLVPTPGQPEQEYLAKRMMNKGFFYSVNQNRLNINTDIDKALSFKGLKLTNNYNVLNERIKNLLEKI